MRTLKPQISQGDISKQLFRDAFCRIFSELDYIESYDILEDEGSLSVSVHFKDTPYKAHTYKASGEYSFEEILSNLR